MTPPERATARLLEELRAAPTLSKEAFARIERRLRENSGRPRRRRVLDLAGPWMPALAGAAAMVLVVGAFTFAILRRDVLVAPTDAQLAYAPALPRQVQEFEESVAAAKKPAQPAEVPPPAVVAKRERAWAPPPSAGASKSVGKVASVEATSEQDGLVGRPRRLSAAAPFSAAGQASATASAPAASSAPDLGLRAADEAAAPPSNPALIEQAEQLAHMGRCTEAIAAFTHAMEGSVPAPIIERALYGRARCRLTLGEQDAGRQDLRTYILKFPQGRFAGEARDLLQ
jgi:hypothetical protein